MPSPPTVAGAAPDLAIGLPDSLLSPRGDCGREQLERMPGLRQVGYKDIFIWSSQLDNGVCFDRNCIVMGILTTENQIERDKWQTVLWRWPAGLTLGSTLRQQELQRQLKIIWRKHGASEIQFEAELVSARFETAGHMTKAVAAADGFARRAAHDKVPPKVVEEALGITARERLAMTKAGIIRSSGRGSFRAGSQTIRVPYYALADVEELCRRPERIAAWRAEQNGAPT
jgi:hypothetical protein